MDNLRWRLELAPECRLQQTDRILVTLMIFFPNCASMDLAELVRMAEWLEEDTFIDAISYMDYLHRINVRLLKMEIRFPTNTAAFNGMQSQMYNQGQQLLSQNTIVSDGGAKRSASLSPALSSMTSSLTQTSVPNVVAGLKMQSGTAKRKFSSQGQQLLQNHRSLKQNLLQPTQMSNVVGRSTNTQSETAHAQDLFQKKQQHQLMNPQIVSSSMNSSNAQTGQTADDWQEETYQKMQAIKQRFLPYLKDLYQKFFKECQHLKRNDSDSNVPQCERQKLVLLETLEGHMRILNVSKDNIVPAMKGNLSKYEKRVIHVIQSNWPREPVSAQQQIQQPGGHPLPTQTQPQPQPQQQQQQEEVDNQPDATNEIIEVESSSSS